MLTHIDLFAGIGGFSLAARWAGFETICYVEIDPFCQEVLKARFGAVADTEQRGWRTRARKAKDGWGPREPKRDSWRPLLIPDIRDFDGTRFRGATLLTGGFPCQPFSCAGKRRGKADDRAIWPEMRRVIAESRPHWVLAENVSGIISMELDTVLADLEMEGYTCRTFHIGAVAVNAPHRRMRVWIVAHSQGKRSRETGGHIKRSAQRFTRTDSDAPDTATRKDDRRGRDELGGKARGREGSNPAIIPSHQDAGNTDRGQLSRASDRSVQGGANPDSIGSAWDIPWIEVAARFCRVDDGLPAWVHSRRVQRLKALGNAIVPAVAHEIIKCIAEIELGNKT